HSYYGDQLVYGQTRISKELYKPLKGTFDHIKNMSSAIDAIDTNQFLDLKTLKIHQNSFFDPVQVIYSLDNISLSEVSLTGHILVQSKTKITVDASAMLKDVILIAPIIAIKDESKGILQAFATKEITIG